MQLDDDPVNEADIPDIEDVESDKSSIFEEYGYRRV